MIERLGNSPDRVKICYYNDLHGNTDIISGMANSIKAFKERNTLGELPTPKGSGLL